jgi:hypothetical protein
MCQVRDDRLAAVARIAADQIVEHASLAAQVEDRAGLVHIEMRRPHPDAQAQHPAMFGVRLGGGELELRAVEFHGYFSGIGEAPAHSVGARGDGGAALQEIAARPPWTREVRVGHSFLSRFALFRTEHAVL